MNDSQRVAVAEILNRFPEVEWDRLAGTDEQKAVFGWLARDDGRHDFLLIQFGLAPEGIEWTASTTSSAELSPQVSIRLYGEEGRHNPCERVEDVLGELVARSVHA